MVSYFSFSSAYFFLCIYSSIHVVNVSLLVQSVHLLESPSFSLIISQSFTPSALCGAVVNDAHPSGLQAPCLSWGVGGAGEENTWLERSEWLGWRIESTALDLSALQMLAS